MGLLTVVSRIGAATAPWVAQFLRDVHSALPFTIMGGLTLLSALLCFKLNETLGMATAETMDQFKTDKEQNKGKLNISTDILSNLKSYSCSRRSRTSTEFVKKIINKNAMIFSNFVINLKANHNLDGSKITDLKIISEDFIFL